MGVSLVLTKPPHASVLGHHPMTGKGSQGSKSCHGEKSRHSLQAQVQQGKGRGEDGSHHSQQAGLNKWKSTPLETAIGPLSPPFPCTQAASPKASLVKAGTLPQPGTGKELLCHEQWNVPFRVRKELFYRCVFGIE